MTDWLLPFLEHRPEGLYSPAFDAYLDPPVPAPRAILSHAHADHAVAGHGEIWATPETVRIYRRPHPEWTGQVQEIGFGDRPQRLATLSDAVPPLYIPGAAQRRFSNPHSPLPSPGAF